MGLWIKNADGTIEKAAGGGGGGGGPHNHADYALVEHDHDEFTHDHDYLPLAGGTLTGDLQVGGTITAAKAGNQAVVQSDYLRAWAGSFGTPAWSFYGHPHLGMYLTDGSGLGTIGVSCNLYVAGTIYGTLAFGIADGIDTAEVLGRAETATMPVVDDEGVATTDAESITVNEVVTALLAKVKQLSAEIEELKGN